MNRSRGLFVVLATVGILLGAAAPAAAVPSAQDASFLVGIHQANLYEIASGNLAAQKGTTDEVRRLGQLIAADHTRFDAAVVAVADQVKVALPDKPAQEQMDVLKELAATTGPTFDQVWITREIVTQGESLQAARTELNYGFDPRVKDLARQSDEMFMTHVNELHRVGAGVNVG
ncbi:hypothetical protein Cme02nite_74680 [Catellatospora methionotrophica]|uniref:DUF4142 domain-containing protein n=1 Tax=Catellatospora methionotrophica TaxID=121620 RepID=A0A8J3PL44_9ACTN|nr:DUF4142 domain-containing protein [Catellatospora methionotrophica]GIG19136.1 hypothetical protein Cme02nite_74680 [Catellatospora methionotrophica]